MQNNLKNGPNIETNSEKFQQSSNDEMSLLKSQVEEMSLLRSKVEEMSLLKSQVEEMSLLKPQVEEMSLLKSQVEEMSLLKPQVEALSTDLEEAKKKINDFYSEEKAHVTLREKRLNHSKRSPTQPINLNHFLVCLDFTKSNPLLNDGRHFSNARNRISCFLLYFSGFQVTRLSSFTFFELAKIFGLDLSNLQTLTKTNGSKPSIDELSVLKKRDQQKQSTFTIDNSIRNEYIFGNYNLKEDFLFLVTCVNKWAENKNISVDTWSDFSFFTTFKNPDKPISRVNLTKTINAIVRSAAKIINPNINSATLKTFSSKSFRVNVAMTLIEEYDISTAQQYLQNSSISTIALSNRTLLYAQQIEQTSVLLGKPPKQYENDKDKVMYEKVMEVASDLADAKSFSMDEIKDIESDDASD